MKTTLAIIQIILSLVLAALIFLQSNGDSESMSMNSVTTEKRGWEKVIFNLHKKLAKHFVLPIPFIFLQIHSI